MYFGLLSYTCDYRIDRSVKKKHGNLFALQKFQVTKLWMLCFLGWCCVPGEENKKYCYSRSFSHGYFSSNSYRNAISILILWLTRRDAPAHLLNMKMGFDKMVRISVCTRPLVWSARRYTAKVFGPNLWRKFCPVLFRIFSCLCFCFSHSCNFTIFRRL